MKDESRNFILAIVISFAIFWIFSYFFQSTDTRPDTQQETTQKIKESNAVQSPLSRNIIDRTEAINLNKRITFENELVKGSVNIETGFIDDLFLKKYKNDENEPIYLLNPQDSPESSIINPKIQNIDNKSEQNNWVHELTDDRTTIKLKKIENNLEIERTYSIRDNYRIVVSDQIKNIADSPQKIRCHAIISQLDQTKNDFEFVSGILNNKLHELTLKNIKKKDIIHHHTKGGWVGAAYKYWLTSVLLLEKEQAEALITKNRFGYDINVSFKTTVLQPNQEHFQLYNFFVGPKHLEILEKIKNEEKVDRLDLSVNFGWLYFINLPLTKFLNYLYDIVGNFGIAIIILTTIIKILTLPLSLKSHRSMVKMRKISPQIESIKKQYAKDKLLMNQKIFELYKHENIKPMGGFWPILLQLPIFICLYKVLTVDIEMRQAPFFGWIKDLSAPDPTSFFNLFGLLPYESPAVFSVGLFPIIMGLTMFIQQKMTPQIVTDNTQQKAMLLMPIIFTYIFASLPVGLILYFSWSTILGIFQQLYFDRFSV